MKSKHKDYLALRQAQGRNVLLNSGRLQAGSADLISRFRYSPNSEMVKMLDGWIAAQEAKRGGKKE